MQKSPIHLFGSGLSADRLEDKNPEDVKTYMKNHFLDHTPYMISPICDFEEPKRFSTIQATETSRALARNRGLELIDILSSLKHQNYTGYIIRVNAIQSKEFEGDKLLFASMNQNQKSSIHGVYIPDVESPDDIYTASNELGIPIHKIMPIIETEKGHNNVKMIAETLIENAKGNLVSLIGTGNARHYFYDRAKHINNPNEIFLTPDTCLGSSVASIVAAQKTQEMIRKLNEISGVENLQLIGATSTLIDIRQNPAGVTHQFLTKYGPNFKGVIGKVCIHPHQVGYNQEDMNPPLDHVYIAKNIIAEYIQAKAGGNKPMIHGYAIVDVDFAIALKKMILEYGLQNTLDEFFGLDVYMGPESILLTFDILEQRHAEIVNFQYQKKYMGFKNI